MHMITYPARIDEAGPNDFVVQFVDVPEALTGGATREAAWAGAGDVLAAAIETYLELDRAIPPPRPAGPGETDVALDPTIAARVELRRLMAEQGVTGRNLAQRLGKDEKAVRRMLAGEGASLGATLQALKVLGARPALAF